MAWTDCYWTGWVFFSAGVGCYRERLRDGPEKSRPANSALPWRAATFNSVCNASASATGLWGPTVLTVWTTTTHNGQGLLLFFKASTFLKKKKKGISSVRRSWRKQAVKLLPGPFYRASKCILLQIKGPVCFAAADNHGPASSDIGLRSFAMSCQARRFPQRCVNGDGDGQPQLIPRIVTEASPSAAPSAQQPPRLVIVSCILSMSTRLSLGLQRAMGVLLEGFEQCSFLPCLVPPASSRQTLHL